MFDKNDNLFVYVTFLCYNSNRIDVGIWIQENSMEIQYCLEVYVKDKVLAFINQHVLEKGYPPSMREIGKAVGLKSTSSVHQHIAKLVEEGHIRKTSSKSRAIELCVAGFDGKHSEPSRSQETLGTSLIQDNIAMVPVVGEIAAGTPILAVENIDDYVPLNEDQVRGGEYFYLKIRGDSMINKGILNKDLVLIRKQKHAENGQMVAALLDDAATVKTYYKEEGRIRLQPENDSMSPIYTDFVEILGIVKGVFRKY